MAFSSLSSEVSSQKVENSISRNSIIVNSIGSSKVEAKSSKLSCVCVCFVETPHMYTTLLFNSKGITAAAIRATARARNQHTHAIVIVITERNCQTTT